MNTWQREMFWALNDVANRLPEFTNDDVFEQFEQNHKHDLFKPEENNKRSYGPIVQLAIKHGTITWTGHTVVSRRKNCHKMLIRVYKSNIYKKPTLWYRFKKWINCV